MCKCSNIEDVNDLLQETYVELYKTIKRKKYIILENYQNYIIGIAKNIIQKHYGLLYKLKIFSIWNNKNDLNLKEIISFGSIWYNHTYDAGEGVLGFDMIEFPDVDDDIIWQMLFSDTTLQNEFSDNNNNMYPALMSVSVDIPLLGYKNISAWVTETGYLVTNILETGKGFYIGEENVQKFVDYIIQNYEGFKIVYVDENGNQENDNTNTVNEKEEIVVVNNTITENINGL